jgi:hypothetical protein
MELEVDKAPNQHHPPRFALAWMLIPGHRHHLVQVSQHVWWWL